jgi:hypothetical protein
MTTYELNASTAAAEDDTTPRAAVEKQPAPACAPPPPEVDRSPPAPQEVAETPERTAERQRPVNELLGIAEPNLDEAGADDSLSQTACLLVVSENRR